MPNCSLRTLEVSNKRSAYCLNISFWFQFVSLKILYVITLICLCFTILMVRRGEANTNVGAWVPSQLPCLRYCLQASEMIWLLLFSSGSLPSRSSDLDDEKKDTVYLNLYSAYRSSGYSARSARTPRVEKGLEEGDIYNSSKSHRYLCDIGTNNPLDQFFLRSS